MFTSTESRRFAGLDRPLELIRTAIRGLDTLAPVGDLVIRLWVANVFWKSGLSKIQSVESTRRSRPTCRCSPN
jgi:hypothetical protein